MKNLYVPSPGKYDIDKMRAECVTAANGDFYNKPQDAKLHYHKVGEECNASCEDYPHQEQR